MTIVLNNVVSPNNTSVTNANFQKIQDSINNDLLNREVEVGQANEMRTHLDMNSNRVGNLGDGILPQDAVTFSQMGDNLTLTTAAKDAAIVAQGLAEDAVVDASTQVTLATTQADIATTQAGISTAQAGISTAQAVISTAQAVISTEQAAIAVQAALDAEAALAGGVLDITAGTGIAVDSTDPNHPIVSSTVVPGGQVDSVVAGTNITVDATDPANPIVSTLPIKVDIATFIQGVATDAEKLMTYVVNKAFDLPVGLTGSNAYAEVVATAAAEFTIHKNGGASLGTINFALGASIATFTFTTLTSFIAGDVLQVVNQATADATLADVAISIRGEV